MLLIRSPDGITEHLTQAADILWPSTLVMLESGTVAVYPVAALAGRMTTATDCQHYVLGFTFSP